jgi:hypothetical protein
MKDYLHQALLYPSTDLAEFHDTLVFIRRLFQFSHFVFRFPTFSTWASMKRLEKSKCASGASKIVNVLILHFKNSRAPFTIYIILFRPDLWEPTHIQHFLLTQDPRIWQIFTVLMYEYIPMVAYFCPLHAR